MPVAWPAETTLADTAWNDAGLWAIDTVNPNSLTTLQDKILPSSSADALLVQETKRADTQGRNNASRKARKLGWSCELPAAAHGGGGPSGSKVRPGLLRLLVRIRRVLDPGGQDGRHDAGGSRSQVE